MGSRTLPGHHRVSRDSINAANDIDRRNNDHPSNSNSCNNGAAVGAAAAATRPGEPSTTEENLEASTETENSFLARITRAGRHHAHTTPPAAGAQGPSTTLNASRSAVVPVDFSLAFRAAAAANNNLVSNNGTFLGGEGWWQGGGALTSRGQGEDTGGEWWAGEEYEQDWGCIFDAYLCQHEEEGRGDGDGRLPCVAAREVSHHMLAVFCEACYFCLVLCPVSGRSLSAGLITTRN